MVELGVGTDTANQDGARGSLLEERAVGVAAIDHGPKRTGGLAVVVQGLSDGQ